MKILYRLTLAVAVTFAMTGCGHDHADEHDHDDEHDHEAELHEDNHGHKHGDEITLNPDAAKRFGVKVETIAPGEFVEVVKVSGQIMPSSGDRGVVSATTSGIFTLRPGLTVGSQVSPGASIGHISAEGITGGDPNVVARMEVESARRELERIMPLYKEGIVSQKDYYDAEARVRNAEAAYSAPAESGAATSRVGGIITELAVSNGEYVEAGQLLAVVSQNTRMTLRADMPQRYYTFLPHITGANFRPDYLDYALKLSDMGGQKVSGPSSAGATGGYIPVYFSFDNKAGVVPGAYAEVFLIGNRKAEALTVPLTAIVENQGNKYVYTRVHDNAYMKHLVTTGGDDGINVEILSGLTPGDQVVTEGARVVSMAETSSVAPPGHSHNH